MITLNKLFTTTLLLSAALSIAIVKEDHHHHDHYDHHEYLKHWNIDPYHGHDYHHHHHGNYNIHQHLHDTLAQLKKIHALLEHNNLHNHKQDQLLKENRELINRQIDMQAEDAARDDIQDQKLDNAVLQRKDIKDSVDLNTSLINDAKNNQAIIMDNQGAMAKEIDHVHASVDVNIAETQANGKSLDNLHMKMNAHDAAFVKHAHSLKHLMAEHDEHDAKQDALILMNKQHDERQNELRGQVMINQEKLKNLQAGQAVTQDMIAVHDKKADAHALNMDDFKAKQFNFNNKAAVAMAKADEHMNIEKAHMADEQHHMSTQDTHMKMEALHMAESEDHMIKTDHHNHHHYLHGHHHHRRPRVVRVIKAIPVRHARPSILVGEAKE
jgi:hypothetical protein